ncbi:hypothetical protein ACFOW6_12205 [Fodinicurvata halophila]|uniref:Uncharacterized protein n=1 Tax=Fodinicurvata halophila TaxID=1419723 RepID=A0ABV8UNJ2_9PROT
MDKFAVQGLETPQTAPLRHVDKQAEHPDFPTFRQASSLEEAVHLA